MKGFDKFLDRMTIIVTIIFTIFVIIKIGNLWIGLHSLIISPMTGLFVLATYENCAAGYRRSMEQYRKVLESDREKDFLRRKAEGFPKPIYPNTILVTDAYMGYIYGTDEFKQRLSKIKHRIVYYYDRVSWYCQKHEIEIPNDNDLVLIGIWKKQFVFKLFAPENVEYIILPDDTVLTDCFLCDSNTAEVKYIK